MRIRNLNQMTSATKVTSSNRATIIEIGIGKFQSVFISSSGTGHESPVQYHLRDLL